DQVTNLLIAVQAAPGHVLQGTQQIAELSFLAISNQHSAFLPLPISGASAVKPDGSIYTNYITPVATVAVIQIKPLALPWLSIDSGRNLTVFGLLGATYQLQYSTNLALQNGWALWSSYVQTNGVINFRVDS